MDEVLTAKNFNINKLMLMCHSPLRNYIVPGLTSWLIGKPSDETGCVRMFTSEREQQESITPHSHRFDFQCWVLQGSVKNRIWCVSPNGDFYAKSILRADSAGVYEIEELEETNRWGFIDYTYLAGECYQMRADDIHSIYFSKDAKVLFFEGPRNREASFILQPFVEGKLIPTFKVEPWMFRAETAAEIGKSLRD